MEWISNDELKVLTEEAKKAIDEIYSYASLTSTDNNNPYEEIFSTESLNAILTKYKDFEYQRTEILNRYALERESIRNSELSEENKNILISKSNSAKNSEIYYLVDEITRSSSSIGSIFESMRYKTVAEIEAVIAKGEELYAFFSSSTYNSDLGSTLGVTLEEFNEIGNNSAVLTKLNERLSTLEGLTEKSSNGFLGMSKAWDTVTNGFATGRITQIQSGLKLIEAKIDAVCDLFGEFESIVNDISEISDSTAFEDITSSITNVGDAITSTLDGAISGSSFGSAGVLVGGILGFVSSITSMMTESVSMSQQLADYLSETEASTYLAEYEVNQLWRERYDWAQMIGETSLDYAERIAEELEAQIAANDDAQSELMAKLLEQEYDDGLTLSHSFWSGFELVTKWSSLAEKSWEEIVLLAESGKLSDEAMLYYEALSDARDEGEDLLEQELEYLEDMREAITGSTYDSIIDGIVDGFEDGLRSAEDFADSFDELMQEALLSALSLMADDKMREWYESFAEMGEDGYTENEIALAKQQYIELLEALEEDVKNLELVTGQQIGETDSDTDSRTGTSSGIATASQDSVDENNGRLTAIQGHTYEINNNVITLADTALIIRDSLVWLQSNAADQLLALQGIEENTQPISTMQSDMAKVKTTLSDIQLKGVKVIM